MTDADADGDEAASGGGAASPAPGEGCAAPLSALRPRTLSSQQLFAGQTEVLIEHEGQIYRLRRTRGGKLLLTK